jgi:hypothetical protein
VGISGAAPDVFYIGVQILDSFILTCTQDMTATLENHKFISMAAATAAIIAVKLHGCGSLLTSLSFPYFDHSELMHFERRMLKKLDYDINPSLSPMSFIRNMVAVWPNHLETHAAIIAEADRYASAFLHSIKSARFASSTIAVAALFLTFAKLQGDLADWLRFLPQSCLYKKSDDGTVLAEHLDIELCIQSFSELEANVIPTPLSTTKASEVGIIGRRRESPTSVLDDVVHNDSCSFLPISDEVHVLKRQKLSGERQTL